MRKCLKSSFVAIILQVFYFISRRSLSPIAIRASPLGPVKRKCDLDDRGDSGWGPHKKYQHFSPATASHLAFGGPLLVTQLSSRFVGNQILMDLHFFHINLLS